jgi:hypothetical protein
MNPKTIWDVEDEINLGMILRTMQFNRQARKKTPVPKTPAKKDDPADGDDDDDDDMPMEPCTACNGKGRDRRGVMCQRCKGRGKVVVGDEEEKTHASVRGRKFYDFWDD